MRHIDYGLSVLSARAFDLHPPYPVSPLDLATFYEEWVVRGEMAGFEVTQRFYEIGSPDGLEETQRHLSERAKRGQCRGAPVCAPAETQRHLTEQANSGNAG